MNLQVIKDLDSAGVSDYDDLVLNSTDSTFYHTLNYLRLLSIVLRASPTIIMCYKEGRLVGAMPSFIGRNAKFGNVLNSLPFFGSYGGVVVRNGIGAQEAGEVLASVLTHLLDELSRVEDIAVSTVITWPFVRHLPKFKESFSPQYQEERIAQMVTLPTEATEDQLLQTFESRCRRSIKRATSNRVTVRVLESFESGVLDQFYEIHAENMKRIDAPSKPKLLFQNIGKFFEVHKDYDIYVAEYRNEIAAALLVFYFGDIVEYYLPAVRLQFRLLNPMNLILLKAMAEAVQRHVRVWNFGGTRKNMTGIHMFKQGFGARDYVYYSHTRVLSDVSRLLDLTPSSMRKEFEWFYVLPYTALERRDSGLQDL